MAIKITLESFLAVLRRSNLIEAEQIKRLTDEFRAAHGEPPDAKPFADFLVQLKQITAWQAEKLLMGKHKGFFLGRYKLKGLLGKGGMSSVYLAEHVLMRRMCALKVLPARRVNDASYLGRFHREAQAVAALDHPNIVRAYDVDHEEDGEFQIHFLVMEYVDGKSLLDLVTEKGPARPIEAADYIRQAALGLEHAHRAGIIHRDIKPGNLLLDNSGVIKLLDMGLARFFGGEDSESLTIQHDEKVLGTADYLAPEQAVDSHKVDRRADIYSLGCSLYFLLTGHPPFNTGTLAQRLMAHQMKEPPDVTVNRSDVPDALLAIMKKMMAKLPEQRYATAGEAAESLASWLDSQGAATPGVSDSGRLRKLEDSGAIRTAAPAPSPTPMPSPAKIPASASSTPPAPTADEGFAALGDLFGQMSDPPTAPPPPVPAENRVAATASAPTSAAPVDDDVPAFLRGGSAGAEPSGGFPDFFDAEHPAPPASPAPRPAAVGRPASPPAKGAPAKAAPAKAAPKAASPARSAPAPTATSGDDVPDFLRMNEGGPAQAEEFVNPFADAAGPPAAPPAAPKRAAPVAPAAAAKPPVKTPPKAKPAPASPPRAAATGAQAASSASPAVDDVPDFLRGDAGGESNGNSTGAGGFPDLFSDGPASAASPPEPVATPTPAKPVASKPAAKPAPSAAAAAAPVQTPAAVDDVPAFLSGGGGAAAPIGDLFSNAFEEPAPASAPPPAPAKIESVAPPRPAAPSPVSAPPDDVPDFLNLGSPAAAVESGAMPDLFGVTESQAAAPPAPPQAPPKKAPAAPPAKAAAKAPVKAAPAPAAEPDVPDFLKGGSAPPASDEGFPDFLGAASSPPSPPPAPGKGVSKAAPPKAAAPSKAAAPPPKPAPVVKKTAPPAPAPPGDVPDFLAGVAGPAAAEEVPADLFGVHSSEAAAPPVAASPPAASALPATKESVPDFLADAASVDSPAEGANDLFGFGSANVDAAPVSPTASAGVDESSDSPFGATMMSAPEASVSASVPAASDNPFGTSDDDAGAATTTASPSRAAATKKPGGTNPAAAAQSWLKVRRNQLIAGGGGAALLAILLAVAFWPKGKPTPTAPGSPETAAAGPTAAGLASAAAARGSKPPGRPQGETYTVGPTGDFGTVTEAVTYFLKNVPIDGARRTIKVTGGYWYSEAIAVSGIGLSSPLTITSDAASPAVLRPAPGKLILNIPMANGLVLENLVLDANASQGCAQVEALQADSRLTNVEFRNFREFGLLTESVSGEDAAKPVVIENCRFLGGAAGAKGLFVKTSTNTLFGLTIRQSHFQAPMRTGIEFGAGALGNVTVSQCRFVDLKTGLYFPPAKQDIADLLLLNNTFYRVNEGIVFNQAPAGSPQGMKSAVIGNLFVPPAAASGAPEAGGDFVVRAGLTTQNWEAFIKGGPGIAGNMTARGGEVGAKEVDIFSPGGGRRGVSDLAFESVAPGSAGFLKPTSAVSFAPPKVGEPYAGAVAP